MAAPPHNQTKRRGLVVSIGLNVVLLLLACGLVLYAFMLNVDLDDVKRRLSKEVETRQQTERYLTETRNLLTTPVARGVVETRPGGAGYFGS